MAPWIKEEESYYHIRISHASLRQVELESKSMEEKKLHRTIQEDLEPSQAKGFKKSHLLRKHNGHERRIQEAGGEEGRTQQEIYSNAL